MSRARLAPANRRHDGGLDDQDTPEVELRLAIGRDGIGLELARPVVWECLRVADLRTSIRGLKFPVDVSGGVARFRHKWGELRRLDVEIDARAVERWAAPKLRGVVGVRTPEVWVHVGAAHTTVCISDECGKRFEDVAPTLAFEVHALSDADIVLVVARARGVNLAATPTALAIGCLEAMLGPSALRAGAKFTLRAPAVSLPRTLMPDAGARVPSADGIRWTVVPFENDTWKLTAAKDASPAAPTDAATRASEVAGLLGPGDDLLVAGHLERARDAYLHALERAPRHPDVVQRIVDVDARVPGREEAALGFSSEAPERPGAPTLSITRGELLARIGNAHGALASLEHAIMREPATALAARLCELAATQSESPEQAAQWLDRALVASPRAKSARWGRVQARLRLGRSTDALSDVQHIEAVSHGDRERHDVWLRAGRAWQTAGLQAQAATLFERALLYVPDEPQALLGLGVALVETGTSARGATLLARALDLATVHGGPRALIALELACALADRLDDLPSAIARVSDVPRDAPEAILARGLEGRWRARLGDLAGASLAFAAMRDLAHAVLPGKNTAAFPSGVMRPVREVVEFLMEAAEFEETRRHDALAAQSHLAAARWLRPADPHAAVAAAPEIVKPALPAPTSRDSGSPDADDDSGENDTRAARVEQLTRLFQARPDDQAVADELAELLERLGRGHELLALLSARLDDAAPDQRAALLPKVRATLARLADAAESAGRDSEGALYRSALEAYALR